MKYTLACLLSIVQFEVFAQNVTIDYEAWNPSNPTCSLFVSPVNVPAAGAAGGTLEHQNRFGQVEYNTADKSLHFQTQYSAPQHRGEVFRIGYVFKVGFIYFIYVTASSATSSTSSQGPWIRIRHTNSGGAGGTACLGPENIDGNTGGNPASQQLNSSSFIELQFTMPAITTQASQLEVSGFPSLNGPSNTVRIKKIRIVEIPPPASFSVSSSISSMACGATAPVSFSIANTNNTTGITGYTWNLGAIPNGWLYNGSPAPASIPFTASSLAPLSLTPDCGRALSAVSATVAANGVSYNTTNSVQVSTTSPTYSIAGQDVLCSGSTSYNITGLVCNSSIVWSPPATSAGTLNPLNGSPTTLTYGGTPGNIIVTANVTACGDTKPVTKTVRVGPYSSSDFTFSANSNSSGVLYWCPNQTYSFSVGGPASNFVWQNPLPTGWTTNYNGGYVHVMKAPSSPYPPTAQIVVSFTEPCGASISKSIFTAYSSSACTGTDPRFTFSPNPAPSYMNVQVASGYIGTVYIQRIQFVSTSNGLTVFDQIYANNTSTAYITTTSLQSGTYTLRIFDGNSWAAYTFMK
jgi:hypothetical protein